MGLSKEGICPDIGWSGGAEEWEDLAAQSPEQRKQKKSWWKFW